MSWFYFKLLIKRVFNVNVIKHPINGARRFLSRGHSTLEMQIIRQHGIRNGYNKCIIRRKVFEILYSHIVFNIIFKQSDGRIVTTQLFKIWIVEKYLEVAPLRYKNNYIYPHEKTTIEQIFNKDNFFKLAPEEIFVWSLGLRWFWCIGVNTLIAYKDTIKKYNLNVDTIVESLSRLQDDKTLFSRKEINRLKQSL